ncbi:hypothetical protein TNCV_4083371 [Trichonephila clavipes]|nr:hypothetical protein TNCV_4083371 [Trichonephila clavipes]
MRSIKKEAVAKIFCGVMNLTPTSKCFYDSMHTLNNATDKVTKVSMGLAAAETISFNHGCPEVNIYQLGVRKTVPYSSAGDDSSNDYGNAGNNKKLFASCFLIPKKGYATLSEWSGPPARGQHCLAAGSKPRVTEVPPCKG